MLYEDALYTDFHVFGIVNHTEHVAYRIKINP